MMLSFIIFEHLTKKSLFNIHRAIIMYIFSQVEQPLTDKAINHSLDNYVI